MVIYPKPGTPDGFYVCVKNDGQKERALAEDFIGGMGMVEYGTYECDIVLVMAMIRACIKRRIYFRFNEVGQGG